MHVLVHVLALVLVLVLVRVLVLVHVLVLVLVLVPVLVLVLVLVLVHVLGSGIGRPRSATEGDAPFDPLRAIDDRSPAPSPRSDSSALSRRSPSDAPERAEHAQVHEHAYVPGAGSLVAGRGLVAEQRAQRVAADAVAAVEGADVALA